MQLYKGGERSSQVHGTGISLCASRSFVHRKKMVLISDFYLVLKLSDFFLGRSESDRKSALARRRRRQTLFCSSKVSSAIHVESRVFFMISKRKFPDIS